MELRCSPGYSAVLFRKGPEAGEQDLRSEFMGRVVPCIPRTTEPPEALTPVIRQGVIPQLRDFRSDIAVSHYEGHKPIPTASRMFLICQ